MEKRLLFKIGYFNLETKIKIITLDSHTFGCGISLSIEKGRNRGILLRFWRLDSCTFASMSVYRSKIPSAFAGMTEGDKTRRAGSTSVKD